MSRNEPADVLDNILKQLPEAAHPLFLRWTRGLFAVAAVMEDPGSCVLVAKDADSLYHVLAFFTAGDDWHVSCDAQAVHADQAFHMLARRLS